MMAMTANRRATDSPRMPQAVPKRIHTRSPGRPGKPIHYRRTTPSPLLCGAHNKGEHIVRGEVGSIVQSSLQGMAMGLRSACCISRLFAGVRTAFGFRNIAISALIERMSMAWHLRHAQGRGAHSAGQTRSCPPQTAPAAGSGRPHDVRKGIIRRQGGRLPRCSIQRVRMGLRVTDGAGGCGRLPDTRSPATKTARDIPRTSHCMSVAGQLLYRERGLADSAGQIF